MGAGGDFSSGSAGLQHGSPCRTLRHHHQSGQKWPCSIPIRDLKLLGIVHAMNKDESCLHMCVRV